MPKLQCGELELNYESSGDGDTTLLFLHGTGGDQSYFAPQYEHFKSRFRVVGMDLRGHGASDRCDPARYRVERFADDLIALAGRLGLRRTVIVGHSLGGLIALETASRSPAFLAGALLLDTPIFVPAAVAQSLGGLTALFKSEKYAETLHGFAEQYFFSGMDHPERKKSILAHLGTLPRETFVELWEESGRYDAEKAAKSARVPLGYIHASVPVDLEKFKSLVPSLATGQVLGSGHYLQLEVPEQVNAMIERFVAKYVSA